MGEMVFSYTAGRNTKETIILDDNWLFLKKLNICLWSNLGSIALQGINI